MVFLALWIIALLTGAAHVSLQRKWTDPVRRIRILLLYQLLIASGVGGLFMFVGHALRPAVTAAMIGWPSNQNFQFELGSFGLGIAIADMLCLIINERFYWLGVAVAPSVFMILAALNHVRDALSGNLASYNTVTIVPDLLLPCTLGWLLLSLFRAERSTGP